MQTHPYPDPTHETLLAAAGAWSLFPAADFPTADAAHLGPDWRRGYGPTAH